MPACYNNEKKSYSKCTRTHTHTHTHTKQQQQQQTNKNTKTLNDTEILIKQTASDIRNSFFDVVWSIAEC